jgi:hypothetical protein
MAKMSLKDESQFKVDTIVEAHGHICLRLPAYHCKVVIFTPIHIT